MEFPEILLPEKLWTEVALLLRDRFNWAFSVFWEVASGKDLKKFLYVQISPYPQLCVIYNFTSCMFLKRNILCQTAEYFRLVDCVYRWQLVRFSDPCLHL